MASVHLILIEGRTEDELKDTQCPRPLLTAQIPQLLLNPIPLLDIDDGRVGDVGYVDPHDEVDE